MDGHLFHEFRLRFVSRLYRRNTFEKFIGVIALLFDDDAHY